MRSGRRSATKRVLVAAFILLCAPVLSGCVAADNMDTRDSRIDALGQRIVGELKTQPAVVNAEYDYVNNVDQGQVLSITIIARSGHTDPGSTEPLVDQVFRDAWRTPTALGTVSVEVHPESNPNGDTVAGNDLILPPNPQDMSDQKDLYAKLTAEYGPYRH